VYLHNQIPVGILHVLEADITKDTSIVDEDIYPTKGLDSRIDDPVAILNRVVVGDSVTAS